MAAPSHVILLDPSLIFSHGHHLPTAREVVRQAQKVGASTRVFCHTEAAPDIRALPATPLFQLHGYVLPTIEDKDEEYAAVLGCNNVLLGDLVNIRISNLTPDDFLFFPTLTASQIIAVCQWIASFPSKVSPKFGLGFLVPFEWNGDGHLGHSKEYIFKTAFDLIPVSQKANIVCTCETEDLARDYERVSGISHVVQTLPTNMSTIRDRNLRHDKKPDRESLATVGLFGHARLEKGTDLVPDILKSLVDRDDVGRIIVHMMPSDYPSMAEVENLARSSAKIHYSNQPLPEEFYVALLSQVDVSILPYNPENYQTRGSGMFMECQSLGIPMVVPSDTWMGETIRSSQAGDCFEDHTVASIVDATANCIATLDQKKANALTSRPQDKSVDFLTNLLDRVVA